MEKTENGCILLKEKEYDDLLAKSKENRAKEIKVTWSYSNLGIMGDFMLSQGLYKQIRNILLKVDLKHIEEKVTYFVNKELLPN